jgi:basic membrane protein A
VSHHHSPDEDTFTARLVTDLKAAGADVWVDTKDISSGDFVERINAGLSDRHWLVLIMTPAALASNYVQAEVNAALNDQIGGRMRGVLPFVVQPCKERDIPPLWRTLHRFDAVKGGYAAARDQLFKTMALLTPSPPPPPLVGAVSEPTPASSGPASPGAAAPAALLGRRIAPGEGFKQSDTPARRVNSPFSTVHSIAVVVALVMILIGGYALLQHLSANSSGDRGGQSGTQTVGTTLHVGLVTNIGGLNDKGYNHLAYVGLMKAQADLGVQVSVSQSQSNSDYVTNLTHYASSGYQVVIAVDYPMASAVGQVSQQYPAVRFVLIDSDPTDARGNAVTRANVMSLVFKEEDAGALVGVLTGMLEKQGKTPKPANVVGAVGGEHIPPVDAYIAGFQWGVRREDSSAQVLIGYAHDFSNQARCSAVAMSQIASGADVLFQVAGGCGLSVFTTAQAKGIWSIGVDTDEHGASTSVIASAIKRVDVATYDAIKSIRDGHFKAGESLFGLAEDGVGWAVGNQAIPTDIQDEITRVSGEITAGTVIVPNTLG